MIEKSASPLRSNSQRRAAGVSLLTLGLLALSSCAPEPTTPSTDAGETSAHLRLADAYAPTHPISAYGASVFQDEMEEAGHSVDYFPAGQMGNARDLAHLTRTGVLDIAPASPAYLEDELPLSSVSDLPNMTQDACVAANAMMDLLDEDGILYEAEYEPRGLRPLWIAIIPGYEVMTADTQVASPEDVQGQVLRSAGGAFDVTIDAIGASAVSMSAGDTYEAIARGTIDGTPMPYVSAVSYNLEEVANYSTDGLNLGSVGIPYVISEQSWQSLTPGQQDRLQQSAATANQTLCEGLNKDRNESKQLIIEEGMNFTEIEGPLAEDWDNVLANVRAKWAASLDDIDLPGTEVLDAYEEAVERHES